jgi:dTDP-4-dehydrorhamnose reductase
MTSCMVLGASGQMGRACLASFVEHGISAVGLSKEQCDVTNGDAVRAAFQTYKPKLVINTAAYTAVDACEANQGRAYELNAKAAGEIAKFCARSDATLIHLSTDYVFGDDVPAPLYETAPTAPLSVYGQSKLDGENAIRTALERHIILRTSWVFSLHAHNFFKTVMSLAERLDEIKVVADEVSCPTSAPDLAHAISVIAQRALGPQALYGTWHACGSHGVSRLEFATAIMQARARARVKTATITPTTQAAFGAPALRPKDSRMACAALQRDFDITIPSFLDRLDEAVAAMRVDRKDN